MNKECADGSLVIMTLPPGLCLEDLCVRCDADGAVELEDEGVHGLGPDICWRPRLLAVRLNLEGESVLVLVRSLLRRILVIVSCWYPGIVGLLCLLLAVVPPNPP